MSLRINTNVTALNAHRNLSETDRQMGISLERLSSGYRINRAKDDVAGLAIANRFRVEVRGLRMAQQNAAQATALLQVAEGGTNQIEAIVERLKELATTAASDNTDSAGRARLDAEAQKLLSEIDRIANDTKYGTSPLLGAAGGINFTFQIGSSNIAAPGPDQRDDVGLIAVDIPGAQHHQPEQPRKRPGSALPPSTTP